MSKLLLASKIILVYLTVVCVILLALLTKNIHVVLYSMNYVVVFILLLALTMVSFNVAFFLKKLNANESRRVFLYNALFCFVFSFKLRLGSWFINNLIGIKLSIYSLKNSGGSDYGLMYDWFNITLMFFHKDHQIIGYFIEINLLILLIGFVLLKNYNNLRIRA
jgi:hypothetical protein